MVKHLDWTGCYKRGWKGVLTDQSFVHPAKVSLELAERIYGYLLENKMVKEGDTVLDPFGGIGGFAYSAMYRGLSWVGVELEARFQELGGAEYACPGFDEGFWKRYQHRPEYIAGLREYRALCPECEGALKSKTKRDRQGLVVEQRIPRHAEHIYRGNIPLWQHRFGGMPRWGSARLVQGDSRHLRSVIAAAECAVSSPPYVSPPFQGAPDMAKTPSRKSQWSNSRVQDRLNDQGQGYGSTPGNLGNLPEGDYRAAISSPPYAESIAHDAGGSHKETYVNHYGGGDVPPRCYSDNPANLGNLKGDGFNAAISSPPYEEARIGQESGQEQCGHNDAYGATAGQMGAMKSNGYDAAVSSPPYEGSPLTYQKNGLLEDGKRPYKRDYMDGNSENYGGNKDNIANAGDFWSAARQVVAETYAVLAPGAVAVWVVKDFIRNKARVPFCDQWRQLCEACGFSTYAIARAWLVEDHGTQLAMDGNHKHKRTERKSFFRRLAEKKGSPRIDFETVLIMRKPEAAS